MEFLIVLIGLWSYPILSFIVIRLTKKRLKLRKLIITTSAIFTVLAFLGLLSGISTTLSELDWIIVSTIYLTISFILVRTQFQQNKIIKITGMIAMVIVFGIGYVSGTVGILGIGFIVNDYKVEYTKCLENGIIYKEMSLGNAISNYRGKRVEIYKTISWLPIIEWKILEKEYYFSISKPSGIIEEVVFTTPLTVEYKPMDGRIYLSVDQWSKRKRQYINWADTLVIE